MNCLKNKMKKNSIIAFLFFYAHFSNAQNTINLTESNFISNYIYKLKHLEVGNDSLDDARSILGIPTFYSKMENEMVISYVFNIIPDDITREISEIKIEINKIEKELDLVNAKKKIAIQEYWKTPNLGYINTALYGREGISPETKAGIKKYNNRMDELHKNSKNHINLKNKKF
jgi:hypothetical protein